MNELVSESIHIQALRTMTPIFLRKSFITLSKIIRSMAVRANKIKRLNQFKNLKTV